MGRVSAVVCETPRLTFNRLPAPPVVSVEVDYVTGDLDGWNADFVDAYVFVKYRCYDSDHDAVSKKVRENIESIKGCARHVYPPQAEIVKRDALKLSGLRADTEPVNAVDMWFKESTLEYPDGVRDAIMLYLSKIERVLKYRQMCSLTFVSLAVENFMPFRGLHAVEFSGRSGVFGIAGEYVDADGRSNRAGKSALIEAILFCLYGEGRKVRTKDKYISDGETVATVSVVLEVDGSQHAVTRSIGQGKHTLVVDGAAVGSVEGQTTVNSLVGIDKDDFLACCFVRQGDLLEGLSKTSAKLKSDMARWYDVSYWEEVDGMAAKDDHLLEKECYARAVLIDDIDRMISGSAPLSDDEIGALKDGLNAIKRDVAAGENVDIMLTQIEREIDAHVKYNKISAFLKSVDEHEVGKKMKESAERRDRYSDDVERLQKTSGSLSSELETARRNLSRFDGKCPVDNGECPRVHEIEHNKGIMLTKVKNAETKLAACVGDLKAAKNAQADAAAEYMRNYNLIIEIGKSKEEIDSIRDSFDLSVTTVDGLASRKHELRAMIGKVDELRALLSSKETELIDQMAFRKRFDKAVADRIVLQAELADLEAKRVVLMFVRAIVGKTGIPSVQVRNGLVEVEQRANDIMARFNAEYSVEFSYERELKKKEVVCSACLKPFGKGDVRCVRCGNKRGNEKNSDFSIVVHEGNRTQDIDQDSGGGRSLIALAVRIAMSGMIGASVLFLDEVCGALDRENLRQYNRLMVGLRDLGFSQVFSISHREEVGLSFPDLLVVRRDALGGRSSFSWAA